MNDWTELLTIATVSWLGIVSPGPDFAVVVRNSVANGRRFGFTAACGVTAGTVVPLAYSTFGAAIVASETDFVYRALQYIGAAYLAWLGIRALRTQRTTGDDLITAPTADTPSLRQVFLTGVLVTSLNAKAGLFYLSLFAMAVASTTPLAPRLFYCTYILVATMIWTTILATLFSQHAIRRRFLAIGHWFDRLLGGVFLLLALRTALARR